MSRTIRTNNVGQSYPDKSYSFDKRVERKSFMYRGDGWSSKARGGIGNKAGWRNGFPRFLFNKYKEKHLD